MRVENRKTHVPFGSILFGIAAVSICVAFSGWPHAAFARTTESECRTWAHVAAKENGIPPRILQAIAMVESSSQRSGEAIPWPWTVNVNGRGIWFDSRSEALQFLSNIRTSGIESFDVGCFQLNYRWHGDKFASLDQMIEPAQNARYAAAFLADLHREFGNWEQAVMAYHSRTPDRAERYLLRIRNVLSRPISIPEPPISTAVSPPARVSARFFDIGRPSSTAGPRTLGSVVPAGTLAGGKAFFGGANLR